MINGITTIAVNKGLISKPCVGSRVWHNIPDKGWRVYQTKRSKYNNKDEDNSLNILSDKKNNH